MLTLEREHWMRDLPDAVRNISVINLAIPGSHNSMTYGITSSSRCAPDANRSTRRLYFCFPWLVRRWAKTQSASITEQLQLGVRYFDLRIAQQNERFYFAHGLFAMEIFKPLLELRQFLDTHRGEIVVLDFQHFYAMNATQHIHLHKQLLELFGTRLYAHYDGSLATCTLQRCEKLQRQIVLIYRRCPITLPAQFWPSHSWPTPWPNVASTKKLQEFLQNALLSRKPTKGYVSQCILTPTARYISLRCLSSLKRTAKNVDKRLKPWIVKQCPGPFEAKQPARVNVLLGDFVNLKQGEFCELIVNLNTKMFLMEAPELQGAGDN